VLVWNNCNIVLFLIYFIYGDDMDYKKYLYEGIVNPIIFKDISVKNDIINNESRHEITWFCQDRSVSDEMIYNLLDDEGINILKNSRDYLSKVNGIISCGKDISKLFDNEVFLSLLVELNDYYYYLNGEQALKFINYCINNNIDRVISSFNKLNEKSQVYVINNCDMSSFYYELLVGSKLECSKIIVENISSLDNYSYDELLSIFSKDMYIPVRLLSGRIIDKISTIYNVKKYRHLINCLGKNNDVDYIEFLRRKFYDYFLDNCSIIYNKMINEINNGVSVYEALNKYLNCFGGYDSCLSGFFTHDEVFDNLKKSLNYITSEVVVDYLFHDSAYNVFLDINELLDFSNSVNILSENDRKIYSSILSLDDMSVSDKKGLLESLKDHDMISKFYDDYKLARDKRVKLFNDSILNKSNINKYKNLALSDMYGVPVYEMNGNDFYVLVKAIEKRKDSLLSSSDLYAYIDGSSFSIDGSNKLSTFLDTNLYYNLVYDHVPVNQLVHVFEVDSFSKYYRDKNNLPYDSNGTDRINRLYTTDKLVGDSSSYDELVVAQPNKKDDEFNSMLEQPEPFAIYCYDEISNNDVLSAKNTGLGIILVRTKKYDIDNSNRVSLFSKDDKDISYVQRVDDDDTRNRRL